MKKILLLLLLPFVVFGQEKNVKEKVVTSELEYNYLTKTYQSVFEKGENIKENYELISVKKDKGGDFTIEYFYFNNIQKNTTNALLIVITKDKTSKDKVKYLCLPFNNSELMKKFFEETEKLGISMGMAFSASIYSSFASTIDQIKNK